MDNIDLRPCEFEANQVIELLNIYLTEWIHIDSLLWSQVFRYFYVTIVIIFLPNIAGFIGIELPNIPKVIFPIFGILLSCVFLYVSMGYAKRLEAIVKTYQHLINLLPTDLRRYSLDSPKIKHGKLFRAKMSVVLCLLMFLASLCLSFVMLFYYLYDPCVNAPSFLCGVSATVPTA